MLSKYSISELEKSDFPVTVKYLGREASGNAAFAPRATQLDSAHRGLSTKVHTEAFFAWQLSHNAKGLNEWRNTKRNDLMQVYDKKVRGLSKTVV